MIAQDDGGRGRLLDLSLQRQQACLGLSPPDRTRLRLFGRVEEPLLGPCELLLATSLGARKNGMLPTPLAWATIVIGASLLTPLGFFGFILVPVWLIVVGLWLVVRDRSANATPELVGSES